MIDYHVHLERGPYKREWLDRFWTQAQERGITELGITEHTNRFREFREVYAHLCTGEDAYTYMREWLSEEFPLSIREYLSFLNEARQDGIPIKIGLEVDYFPESEGLLREALSDLPVDFLIGSVHVLGKWGFDFNPSYGWQGRDIDDVYRRYYKTLAQGAKAGMFDIIGHLDVVKVFGHRPAETMDGELADLFKAISDSGCCIEVSTAGLRKPVRELYPAEPILKMANSYRIPITISSDAHEPEDVGFAWENAVIVARRCGYQEYRVFSRRESFAEKLPK